MTAKEAARIVTGYNPRPLQAELHRKLRRFNVLVMHRRFGKTVFAINEMIDRGLRFAATHPDLPDPRFHYVAPFRAQAKDIAWDYLKRYTASIPGNEPNESELSVEIPRPWRKDVIRFQIKGADNPMALKGPYSDGTILDEFGEMYPTAWSEAIRPMLADRLGWVIFMGTPKGQNHFYSRYKKAIETDNPAWFGALYKASQSGVLPQEELDELKDEMSEEEYNQEMECSFYAALIGAYFGKEMAEAERTGRLTEVPYDSALPVQTFWDLGMNDVTAIWFAQKHRAEWRVIDYMEAPDLGLNEWAKRIQETKYYFGKHHFPHDIAVRELGTGKSRLEVVESLFGRRNVVVVPRVEDKLDSIQAARRMIGKCAFAAKKCERGVEALRNYQRKWDMKAQVFSPKPLHNWASHGADAFQCFAMGASDRDENQTSNFGGRRPYEAQTEYDPFMVG